MQQMILLTCRLEYKALHMNRSSLLRTILISLGCAVLSIVSYDYFIVKDRVIQVEERNGQFVSYQNDIDENRRNFLFRSSAPTDFIAACNIATPGVVYISSQQVTDYDFFSGASYGSSKGSGVLISPNGYIVTNNHVIEGGKDINVTLNDNREYKASVIGIDPSTDLALIKINEEQLPYIQFGNSDSLQVGEWVLAMGNPYKLQSTVTAGIVSAKARNINILNDQYSVESFIQTDAAVNPGNSGGALVNSFGELVGINTAIISNSGKYEGYSFAVPSNLVQKIVRDLKEYGTVQRGLLGVNIGPVNARLAAELDLPDVKGVYVSRVNNNSAAAEAGIKRNDVIISINNASVNSMPELQEQVARFRPGDVLTLGIIRNGRSLEKEVRLKNYMNTTEVIASIRDDYLKEIGMEVRNLTSSESNRLNIEGAKVISILRGSTIDRSNMGPGFIIEKVNDRPISDAKDLITRLNRISDRVILEGRYEDYSKTYIYTFLK